MSPAAFGADREGPARCGGALRRVPRRESAILARRLLYGRPPQGPPRLPLGGPGPHARRGLDLLYNYIEGATSLDGSPRPGVFSGRKPYGRALKIAFVFDGPAGTWRSCGAGLVRSLPGFALTLESIDDTIQGILGWRLATIFKADGASNGRNHAQSALLALQLALAAWWRSAGVTPDVVLGYGAGELAAACAAGILSAEDALRLVAGSGREGGGPPSGFQPRPALLPFLSCIDGQAHSGPDLGPAHWQACLREPLNRDLATQALAQRGVDLCLGLGTAAVPAAEPLFEAMEPSVATLGRLYAAGVDLTWRTLAPAGGRCVGLPAYPWQRQRFWAPKSKWIVPQPAALESSPPPPRLSRPDLTTPCVAPQSELEQALANAWSTVLGIDGIGIHDNFFELGGDSLQATMLLNRLREDLGKSLPGHVLFEVQTIGELAAYLQRAGSLELGAGSGEQGAGSGEQGAGSLEQGAGSLEQGAWSREQGAGSGEQGAGSSELGAGSLEQGAGIKTCFTPCSLLPAPCLEQVPRALRSRLPSNACGCWISWTRRIPPTTSRWPCGSRGRWILGCSIGRWRKWLRDTKRCERNW